MKMHRREFLGVMAGSVASGLLTGLPSARAAASSGIKAVLFDAFPIFDPGPVFALTEELFPGKGTDLSNVWRTRQFEYAWLRSMSQHYADFWQVTSDALIFAAKTVKVDLDEQKRSRLMEAYLNLKTWPDVPAALKSLQQAGVRLGFLSNFTRAMLDGCIKSSGLEGVFEQVLSTDAAKTYKPDPRAYQLGVDALKLRPEQIVFAAFAGWDAAGAKWFGYPTFWVNRMKVPPEELGVAPDGVGETLAELVRYVVK
jgi:2-haloacid dehalogenase